jgi:hypothetical protein
MKRHKTSPVRSSVPDAAQRRVVQEEVQNYLIALASYPERFAREPGLSFEQHFFSISAGQHASAAAAASQHS